MESAAEQRASELRALFNGIHRFPRAVSIGIPKPPEVKAVSETIVRLLPSAAIKHFTSEMLLSSGGVSPGWSALHFLR
jgi:hypothetical protein